MLARKEKKPGAGTSYKNVSSWQLRSERVVIDEQLNSAPGGLPVASWCGRSSRRIRIAVQPKHMGHATLKKRAKQLKSYRKKKPNTKCCAHPLS